MSQSINEGWIQRSVLGGGVGLRLALPNSKSHTQCNFQSLPLSETDPGFTSLLYLGGHQFLAELQIVAYNGNIFIYLYIIIFVLV